MTYLKQWQFWVAVVVVAAITHYVLKMVLSKGGSSLCIPPSLSFSVPWQCGPITSSWLSPRRR